LTQINPLLLTDRGASFSVSRKIQSRPISNAPKKGISVYSSLNCSNQTIDTNNNQNTVEAYTETPTEVFARKGSTNYNEHQNVKYVRRKGTRPSKSPKRSPLRSARRSPSRFIPVSQTKNYIRIRRNLGEVVKNV